MNNLKPTAREVKVILNSIGLENPKRIFNDKRVNGGRIKLWGYEMSNVDMSKMRLMLQIMFPYLKDIKVESLWSLNGRFANDTTIKWKNQ